ncbi:hypothetical protein QWT68_09310 [Sporosarcina trichiuri]|nr:hypothetical protein [Sporosarcina sp. 0.2-SM1T-5]WJY26284.1 hypothetical protein QWT68_09310 [Sporosarcina sp. 0.2-SM1T-5]
MEQVMDGEPLTAPYEEPVTPFSHGWVGQLSEYQNRGAALGYSYRNTVQPLVEERKVKLLQVDGVDPGDDEIRAGTYPYTQEICAVTANTEHPETGRFIEWILSEEGQELVKKSGFTPIRKMD